MTSSLATDLGLLTMRSFFFFFLVGRNRRIDLQTYTSALVILIINHCRWLFRLGIAITVMASSAPLRLSSTMRLENKLFLFCTFSVQKHLPWIGSAYIACILLHKLTSTAQQSFALSTLAYCTEESAR